MAKRDIVVVGASAGGVKALGDLVAGLPAELPASIFITQHVSATFPSYLPDILRRRTGLHVAHAQDGEAIVTGRIYVAPPDRHLMIERHHVQVSHGPKENRVRPAIDPMFRSAAYVHGPRVIGVILTGHLDDGTAGLWAVKHRGGLAISQDPRDAENPSMPSSALQHVKVDHVLPLAEIPALLQRLTGETVEAAKPPTSDRKLETEVCIARGDNMDLGRVIALGEPSSYACPECHGTLMHVRDEGPARFRCHTGHAYSLEALLGEIASGVESTLWNALRAIEEKSMLLSQFAPGLVTDGVQRAELEDETSRIEQQISLVRAALSLTGVHAVSRASE